MHIHALHALLKLECLGLLQTRCNKTAGTGLTTSVFTHRDKIRVHTLTANPD